MYLQRIICKRVRYLNVHPQKIDLTISIPFNQYSILLDNNHCFIVVRVISDWLLFVDFTIESIFIVIESSKVGALEHHFDAQNTYFSTFYLFVIHTTFYDNNIKLKYLYYFCFVYGVLVIINTDYYETKNKCIKIQ